MQKDLQLVLSPKQANFISDNKQLIAKELKISENEISYIKVERKSIDARKKQVKINVWLKIYIDEEPDLSERIIEYPNVKDKALKEKFMTHYDQKEKIYYLSQSNLQA